MEFDIQEELKKLPDCPGVYIHKDKTGQIIYVGKAISLRRRVRQYFQSPKNMPPKVRKMVEHIEKFEYVTTDSEVDALILECRLIKRYHPKYNILLRDDKSYPYIKVSIQEDFPTINKTRRLLKDGARYFGPYPFVSTLDMVIELLNSTYRLKRCGKTSFPTDMKPCLNYHIGRCEGMCLLDPKGEEYRILKAAYAERIEKALAFLDGDASEIMRGLSAKMQEASDKTNFEQAAAYRDYLEAVEEMQGMLRDPKKARDPHVAALKQKQNAVGIKNGLVQIFGKDEAEKIHRIESFDISHIGGIDAVGAMVVFEDLHPDKTSYRRYKTHYENNDYASMQEVLSRRIMRGDALPDLILMDGGEIQVNAALEVLQAAGIRPDQLPVAGLVKNDKHRTKNLYYKGELHSLDAYPELYAYFGRIQEEVHRFAITYHRNLHSKNAVKSQLDTVPGIGEKRRMALLKRFGSIDAIKSATIDELTACGIPHNTAEKLKEILK